MTDNELRTNKVYQIRTIEDIKDDDKIKVEKGKLITAKWETLFFTDDYQNKYFLGQVEVLRCL